MTKFSADRPIYTQIIDLVQVRIVTGVYLPESKLPSVRDLAVELGVNPNTVQRAFSGLEQSGLVRCELTSGRFVTDCVQLIKDVRQKLLKEQTEDYVKNMRHYGCSSTEICDLVCLCAEQTEATS
ncbi:MAG: GntR family transcriptional regulator [Coriobacteriia bacterium]|nr:GntR family transcriptional regulator [Coriobacteriia bacterium]MCL2745853.1 GntR family transcriptional regulator [Coriobacteriia bacterium]MCL2870813.1 GntR family transcriptional regulator [Coriobacteriia bacterium]